MSDTPRDDKGPRHIEHSESKGYAATSISPYKVTQDNAGKQNQDDEAPQDF